MEIPIIYKDDDIIVVNKPPGLSVHGGVSVSGPTLADFLREQFPETQSVGDDPAMRPGIVHRLDKDTSGVMVIARNQAAFEALKNMFKSRTVSKTYTTLVCGKPNQREGVVNLPIGRLVNNPLKRGVVLGRTKIRGEREAVTEYRVLKTSASMSSTESGQIGAFSLVELHPKTGRMHQIRVHMKAIGHPVACDRVYGGKNVCCPAVAEALAGKPAGAGRMMLHASAISFSYPEGRRFTFEAELPEDFREAMRLAGVA